ncbi:MAG: Transcription elongation factor GreA [Parcubacteria group bacterium GW2011_GWA2_39_18]|nr:MAG: Transcription elongation factor GreA [Parcubacteria group bacterium GW2011_GWA2_39_18]
MSSSKTYISEEGLKNLKDELKLLKAQKRREVADRIEEAKKFGDLSENAEYSEALNAQEEMERRIAEIEGLLKKTVLFKKGRSDKNYVDIGSTVEVKFGNTVKIFTIVGSEEADPDEGKISNESPLGMALLSKKVGDIVDVKTPSKNIKYNITKIM